MTETNDKNLQDYRHHCYNCKKYKTKAKQKKKENSSNKPWTIPY